MPTECSPGLFDFAPVEGRAGGAGVDGGASTTDAGARLGGATDRAIGLVRRFAACFRDARTPERIEHEVATLVGQRVFGIALGHEDLVDHDQLRHDPVLAILAGKLEARRPGCAPLAGKSTLNRLEHAPAGEPGRYHRIGHDAAGIDAMPLGSGRTACRGAPRAGASHTPALMHIDRLGARWSAEPPHGPGRACIGTAWTRTPQASHGGAAPESDFSQNAGP